MPRTRTERLGFAVSDHKHRPELWLGLGTMPLEANSLFYLDHAYGSNV